MGIRYYKPTKQGRRFASVSDFSELTDKNKKPEKSLTAPLEEDGREEQPRVHHVPAPGWRVHERMYRLIDFLRNDKDGMPAPGDAR